MTKKKRKKKKKKECFGSQVTVLFVCMLMCIGGVGDRYENKSWMKLFLKEKSGVMELRRGRGKKMEERGEGERRDGRRKRVEG